jgi:hypothetical protein
LFATRNEIQRAVSAAPLAVSATPYLLPKQQKVPFRSVPKFDRSHNLEWAWKQVSEKYQFV